MCKMLCVHVGDHAYCSQISTLMSNCILSSLKFGTEPITPKITTLDRLTVQQDLKILLSLTFSAWIRDEHQHSIQIIL